MRSSQCVYSVYRCCKACHRIQCTVPHTDSVLVTAASLPILRALPVKRLKEYLAAYDIKCVGPKEKEDFVQAVVKARNSATGCLPPENEVSLLNSVAAPLRACRATLDGNRYRERV